jgi:Predicted membrane protein
MNQSSQTRNMVMAAAFTSIILLMTAIPFLGYIHIGVIRATLIHVPVIIGGIILGPKYGAFLGFTFGLTSLWNNTVNPTITSFVFSPFYSLGDIRGDLRSLIICFVPRILIGITAYYTYKLIKKTFSKNSKAEYISLFSAGIIGSLTNTILVTNLIYFLFKNSYSTVTSTAPEALYGVILSIIAINGIPEAIVAALFTTAVARILIKLK